ncbi:MAG: ferritin-like domain-containing protein [Nitrospirota bacterium]
MKKGGIVKEATRLPEEKMLHARIRRGGGPAMILRDKTKKADMMVNLLNEALATEIVCVFRYKRHHFMAAGLSSFSAKAEFLQHAMEEQAHVDQLAERILQLGGEPNLSPEEGLNRNLPEYVEGETLREMITEDLMAKRIVIDSYREMIAAVAAHDSATCRVLEGILAQEEEHAAERKCLLKILGPESKSPARFLNLRGQKDSSGK